MPVANLFVFAVAGVISLLAVYSSISSLAFKREGGSTLYFLFKHGLMLASGFLIMFYASRLRYSMYSRLSQLAIGLTAGLLLLTLMLGIGANGHIGFNEPADELVARTHRVRLADSTTRDNAPLFGGDQSRVPREALSMGMGTILKAGALVLIATGERKARCVERAINGSVTPRLPASFLQLHRSVELYLDRSAASLL